MCESGHHREIIHRQVECHSRFRGTVALVPPGADRGGNLAATARYGFATSDNMVFWHDRKKCRSEIVERNAATRIYPKRLRRITMMMNRNDSVYDDDDGDDEDEYDDDDS